MHIKNILHPILSRVVPLIIWLYMKLVAATSKIQVEGQEYADALLLAKKGFIVAFWHGQQFLSPWVGRNSKNLFVLISRSRDGDYIANAIKFFGIHSLRGSSSRGGAKALVQMVRLIKENNIVAITPDGPRGPIHTVQPGIQIVARKTNCPILPLAIDAKNKKTFASWDRFTIPYPFTTLHIVFGKPLTLEEDTNSETHKALIKEALDKATHECAIGLTPA